MRKENERTNLKTEEYICARAYSEILMAAALIFLPPKNVFPLSLASSNRASSREEARKVVADCVFFTQI